MKNKKINASSFRLIMTVMLFVIAAIIVAVVMFSQSKLNELALNVNQISGDAEKSKLGLQSLKNMDKELESKKEIVEKASNIVAQSKQYQYQDQIIKDINAYASSAGLKISNFSFTDTKVPSTTPGTGTQNSPSAPVANEPEGLKSTYTTITINSPIEYKNLLQFIHSIEKNLTKMQISRINMSRGEEIDQVNVEPIEIRVYTK